MFDTTQFSRRRMLKIGAAGAVGVGALSIPLGRAASGKSASNLATANFPRPYQATFQRPPVLQPTSSTVDGDGIRTNFYTVTEMQSTAQIVPGLTTPVWAYNGSVPGPTISLGQGTRAVLTVRNQLPATHPTFGHAFATSTADGTLSYDDHTESGLWGDTILVNGRPWPVLQVKRRVYRCLLRTRHRPGRRRVRVRRLPQRLDRLPDLRSGAGGGGDRAGAGAAVAAGAPSPR